MIKAFKTFIVDNYSEAIKYTIVVFIGINIGVATCGFKEWFPENPVPFLSMSVAFLSMLTARSAVISRQQEEADE